MKILAIDPGTKMGWAIGVDGNVIDHGAVNLTPKRNESKGMVYVRFRSWLTGMINQGFDVVYFEEVRRHIGTDAAHRYGGLIAQIQEICVENDIEYSSVPVGKWKKHLTGKGSAHQSIYMAHVRHRGFTITTDDEAAAIGICLWCLDQ